MSVLPRLMDEVASGERRGILRDRTLLEWDAGGVVLGRHGWGSGCEYGEGNWEGLVYVGKMIAMVTIDCGRWR